MKKSLKIFLIGLPGSGKSFLGKKLADYLNIPFIDLDTEIESLEGKSISFIFSEKGEDYFRKWESYVLSKWCSDKADYVMATGGGLPCFFDNLEKMKAVGQVIFLDVPIDIILSNLKKSKSNRPLLKGLSDTELENEITLLMNKRYGFYNKANVSINNNTTLDQIKKLL